MTYPIHPAADALPMLKADELQALADNIKREGLQVPITVVDGQVIDGRNRLKACEMAGVPPIYDVRNDIDDIPMWVWSLNAERRHLSSQEQKVLIWKKLYGMSEEIQAARAKVREEQRAKQAAATKAQHEVSKPYAGEKMVVVQSGQLPSNDPDVEEPEDDEPVVIYAEPKPKVAKSRELVAEAAKVNKTAVARAEALERKAPELAAKVASGELSYSDANKTVAKAEREKLIAEQRVAIETGKVELPSGVFEVVSMDPPWNYGREYDPETSRVANPYPEMTQEQLLALAPPFADDCALFLWTTHAFLFDAKALLDHWGFAYKATMVWNKQKIGMGRWLRMQCEFCLVGIKGKPHWNNTKWRDIIDEPRREHSRKPDVFYQMVEEITIGRRLEYFSREKRRGWEVVGNDTDKF